jgi:DNA mismatch endonuclease (patch repair protein)
MAYGTLGQAVGMMSDVFTSQKRSEVMSRIRGTGNKATELKLAAMFRAYGFKGWRRHQPLFGKPDFVFSKCKVVVFVDGCFWHGCPKHGAKPRTNSEFWMRKLLANRTRDTIVTRTLRKQGWRVLRIWEHNLTKKREHVLVRRLRRILD